MHAWLALLVLLARARARLNASASAPVPRQLDETQVPAGAALRASAPPKPDTDFLPLDFGTKFDGKLYANGKPFFIKGINWYGTESGLYPPGGMEFHDVSWYCEFLSRNDFNAIRILFNHKAILDASRVDPGWPNAHSVTRGGENTYLQMFLAIAKICAKHGLLIMMACHRLDKDAWPGNGLWYDNSKGISEKDVMQSWSKIAKELCPQWNVFAVDLQNEPHGSSWGKGMGFGSDWGKAAERLGNHIMSVCPRWLVMVEGVGYTPGAPGTDASMGIWWGENLVGVQNQPVKLKEGHQSKLVYSPHTYGPSVYMQHYFQDAKFPHNMEGIWNSHFAYVQQRTGQPIVVGEMGGFYVGKDKVWQDWAFDFMKKRSIGVFYFCLNPDSTDTGGILGDDWTTPNRQKLNALSTLPSSRVTRTAASPSLPTHSPPLASPLPTAPLCTLAPSQAPANMWPPGWECVQGRTYVGVLDAQYKTCGQPKNMTEQKCSHYHMLTPAEQPRPCIWTDGKCVKGLCAYQQANSLDAAQQALQVDLEPLPPLSPPSLLFHDTPSMPSQSSLQQQELPEEDAQLTFVQASSPRLSREAVLKIAGFSVACGGFLLTFAVFYIFSAAKTGPNFKQRLQSTRIALEDVDDGEMATSSSNTPQATTLPQECTTKSACATMTIRDEAEYDL